MTVRERGMAFNTESVCGILAGRKTNTRRVVSIPGGLTHVGPSAAPEGGKLGLSDDPDDWGFEDEHGVTHVLGRGHSGRQGSERSIPSPILVGDRIWVRETWSPDHRDVYPCIPYVYRADRDAPKPDDYREHVRHCDFGSGGLFRCADCLRCAEFRWRSPRFMPKKAARLWLRVTDVAVERLKNITPEGCVREGILDPGHTDNDDPAWWRSETLLHEFSELWDKLNAKRGHPWESNPFVWVYTFEKEERL